MRHLLLTISATIWLLFALSETGQSRVLIADPGVPDTVYSDSSFTVLGDPFVIPVYFFNDQPLAAIEITLCHNSPNAAIDSFSFLESRVEYVNFKGYSILGDTITVFAYQSSEIEIQVGRGLIGNIYLSYPPGTGLHMIEIDTTTVIVNLVERGNYFSVQELESFSPQFLKGRRNLQLSCCSGRSGDIDGSGSEIVDIVDLTFLIMYLFIDETQIPECVASANVDGSTDGIVDIGDLTHLIGYLFIDTPAFPLAPCP